jgi:hypothetical protein
MKAESLRSFFALSSGPSKPRRALSSFEVVMSRAAAEEFERRQMIASAFSVGALSSLTVFGPERIDVPADSMSWLARTTTPS